LQRLIFDETHYPPERLFRRPGPEIESASWLNRPPPDNFIEAPMDKGKEIFHFTEFSYNEIPETVWKAWMDCASAWHAEPFRAPTWVRDQPWMTSSIPYARLLVGMDERDNYLGFWPYQMETKRIKGFLPIHLCCPWGGDNQADPGVGGRQYFWTLCTPDPPPGFAAAFVETFMERTHWNMLQTGDVRKNHPFSLAWEDELKRKRLRVLRKQHDAAIIGPWDSFKNYLASLSQNWRKHYRRVYRQVANGKVSVEQWAAFPDDALARVVKRIYLIYRDSWKVDSEEVVVNLSVPSTLANFSARIAAFAREDGLHVVFIKVDGDDAAFHVGVSHGDMSCALQTAYREKYASHGVGFIAQMEYFRYTIEQGMHERNLLGFIDYKKNFGAEVSQSKLYTVFSRDTIGSLAWYTQGLSDNIKKISQQLRKGYAFLNELPKRNFSTINHQSRRNI